MSFRKLFLYCTHASKGPFCADNLRSFASSLILVILWIFTPQSWRHSFDLLQSAIWYKSHQKLANFIHFLMMNHLAIQVSRPVQSVVWVPVINDLLSRFMFSYQQYNHVRLFAYSKTMKPLSQCYKLLMVLVSTSFFSAMTSHKYPSLRFFWTG